MGIFSIKDIEAVSGIRCHTLRIWEQRYGIINPKRTDTNIRYYDDDDLKYILNISILNKHGYKISEISKMSRPHVNEVVLKLSGRSTRYEGQIKGLVSAMLLFDEFTFHKILTTNMIQVGLEQTMMNVIFPFLNEVGILWQIGSIQPAHEHFASNIIKQKLYVAIDGNVGYHKENRKKILLFLPENEQHCIGLLFANYILRSRGQEVVYLGQQIPLEDLEKFSGYYTPDYVFTVLTSANTFINKEKFVATLSRTWPEAKVLVSGIQFLCCDVNYPENVKCLSTFQQFINYADFISGVESEGDC